MHEARFPQVDAAPYRWPFDGPWTARSAGLLLLGFTAPRIAVLGAVREVEVAAGIAAFARRVGIAVVHADEGSAIIEPAPGDLTYPLAGGNAFFRTTLAADLQARGIRNLLIAGLPTEGLMHASMRNGNDLGFECLAVSDACKGTTQDFHEAQLRITTFGNGLFGTVASAAAVIEALRYDTLQESKS